jgi:serine/threonine protein kinase
VLDAWDTETNMRVAIKKCHDVFGSLLDGKRILREIKLLRFMSHENILPIIDVLTPTPSSSCFDEIYFVTPHMGSDLLHVINNPKQKLGLNHLMYIMYQLMRGLKYLHSAGIIHRDLKPDNLIINEKCELVICDFGLACGVDSKGAAEVVELTSYCCTRFYRPPEMLLGSKYYDSSADIWSAACIFGQIVTRRPIFLGRNSANQLDVICEALGLPDSVVTLSHTIAVRTFIHQRSKSDRPLHIRQIRRILPCLNDSLALDFCFKMLAFHPQCRATAIELLDHPFLAKMHDPFDEPVSANGRFSWSMDHHDFLKERDLRNAFLREIGVFHEEMILE